jgi:beta-propeller repeat-containing protein/centrosomal CEP192-like protein/ASPM-SPD-2-Hydin domain-containing protein
MRLNALARTLLAILLGNTLSSVQPQAVAQTPQQANTQQGMQATANYGKLPLTFEANQGQTGAKVKFLSRGQGYTAFLTAGGISLSLRPNQPVPVQPAGNVAVSKQSRPLNTTLQCKLLGAAQNPAVIGENQQPGVVNYFIGKDPTKWLTNVPTYARVRYKNVYPGIDLVYYGNHQQLEYDFAVSPGANPNQIQFEITGANQIDLDDEGNLVLQTISGELRFQSPVIYQESSGQRVPVSGTYVVNDPTHISFQIAQYDLNKPLVIDPVLLYGTYLGAAGGEQASGIAVDSTGSVYIAGYTDSADFSLTTFGSPAASSNHVFVAKLDPTGSTFVYADYLGGNGDDYGIGLALDSSNNVYVTGSTTSTNYPTVNPPYQSAALGPYTGFLSKISADGSSLVYSTYLGGSGFDEPASVAVDTLGDAYVAGTTTSQDFPVANAYQPAALANQGGAYGNYGFLTKFSADGSSLNFSTYFAGNTNVANCGSSCYPTPYSAISAVTVDANGNAYVAGTTNTSNFPYTSGAYLTSNSPVADATIGFVSKFASAGMPLDYSTYFYGSSGNPVGIGAITVDGSGSAYITGTVSSDTTFPTTSTSICNPSVSGVGCSYAFVSKFDPAAATLLYSTFLGLSNYASPQSIALDSSNDAYVVANTSSAAFGTNNAIEGYSSGDDILLVEIDASATTELFATYLGGSGNDFASAMTLDASGNVYVVGSTSSADFPVTQGASQNVLGGGTDAFVVKIGPNSAPAVALSSSQLQYAEQSVGSTSAAQTVLLRNMGSAALSISSIAVSGDFAESNNNCGTDVAAASSCTLSVTFTPTAEGTRSGQITIQDNAAGSPHVISLSGIGSSAVVTFAPASLTFSAQQLGTSSAAQIVTLTNSGNTALSISNIQINGDYSQTSNCPSTLSAGSNCTLNITFTPTVAGTRTGSLSLSDNLSNSPQTVALSGSAYVTAITAAPASLTFGTQTLNTSSAAQVVTVANASASAVTVSSVVVASDFVQTNNCSTIAPNGGTCSISVTFTPTATGIRTGTLTVSDSATGSPQTVSLTGTGTATSAPMATFAPTSLTFAAQQVGTSGTAQAVSLTNSGTVALTISSIVVSGDYSQTNNCPSSLAAGSACAINVTFTPTASGVRAGTLTISDNATGSPQTVSITGSGSDFSLASSTGSDTVKAGSAATYNLTITPLGGSFAYVVKLACSGLPAEASCSFSPATVTPGGSTATSTLSITTTASTAEALPIRQSRHASVYAVWIQLQGIGFFGLVLAGRKRSSKKVRALALLVLLIVGLIAMTGCAGGTGVAPVNQAGTASGSYTITVTGTSGGLQHSVPVTLTVQ